MENKWFVGVSIITDIRVPIFAFTVNDFNENYFEVLTLLEQILPSSSRPLSKGR